MTEAELLARSSPEPNSGCWLWLGHCNDQGYPRYGQRSIGRMALGLTDRDQHALHHCDTPCCVNPAHLYVGTHQQNMADMARRKRARGQPGNLHSAKLTYAIARAIRNDRRMLKEIAADYGVSLATVSLIRNGFIWKDV